MCGAHAADILSTITIVHNCGPLAVDDYDKAAIPSSRSYSVQPNRVTLDTEAEPAHSPARELSSRTHCRAPRGARRVGALPPVDHRAPHRRSAISAVIADSESIQRRQLSAMLQSEGGDPRAR